VTVSWRIVAAEHAEGAFSGEGARLYGGRWNSPGVAVVYTAQSASLAALEMLVRLHAERRMPNYVLFACAFDDSLVEPIAKSDLPPGWRADPAPPRLQQLGEQWVLSGRSAILRVPSAVIETEFNYLLNPVHPDFGGIEIAEPVPFALDLRLLRR
jgi:RES domain-containing protein